MDFEHFMVFKRIFLHILVVRLRSNDKVKSTQSKFLIHTMQIVPQKFCKTFDTQKILPVTPDNDTLHHFRVEVSLKLIQRQIYFVKPNLKQNLKV